MGRGRKNGKKPVVKNGQDSCNGTSCLDSQEKGADLCPVCAKPATQRCSGCRSTFYCGRQHQLEHWPVHKPTCKASPVVVESFSEELGRFLAAARAISPGDLILEESPLLTCPPPSTAPLCLACYKELRADNYIDCPECGWPLCGEDCADRPRDHALECALTTANRSERIRIRNFGMHHPSYQAIGALRCLALEKSAPAKWKALTRLESHCEERARSGADRQERFGVAQFARRSLPGLVETHSEEDILRMCGILQVNGHELPLTDPSLVAVYERASLLAHSCRANCCKSFSSRGTVRIHAARAIAEGEPITICYTDSLWSTRARRSHLHETKLFWCQCERCKDPSELGTDFSALRCEGCGQAGVIPQLTECTGSDESDWVCRHCGATMSAAAALDLVERIGAEVENLNRGDVKACRRFLELWGGETASTPASETELAPDHHYLTDVRITLAQLYGSGGPSALLSLPPADLYYKIALCRRLLKLTRQLVPAEYRLRGLLSFELHAALAEEARRAGSYGESAQARDILQESRECLEDVVKFLRYEPPELPEGQVFLQAKRNMRTMTCLLQSNESYLMLPPVPLPELPDFASSLV